MANRKRVLMKVLRPDLRVHHLANQILITNVRVLLPWRTPLTNGITLGDGTEEWMLCIVFYLCIMQEKYLT